MTEVLDNIYCNYTKSRKGVCLYKDIQIITRRLVFVLLFWSSCIHIIMGQYLFLYNIDLPSCDLSPFPQTTAFPSFSPNSSGHYIAL